MFTSNIIALWFIIFFSVLSLASLRFGIKEIRRGGDKTILRTCIVLFLVFAAIAIKMSMDYLAGKYAP